MALILVVDDESAIVETLAEVLRWKGHEVVTAANGELALEAIAGRTPSLVLLDYMMPVLDGLQTLQRLRADPAHATLPVILMSAAPETSIPQAARWDRFLHKPFREPALLAALAACGL
ncbi:MAG TPA: response regulator [Polyangia bacterium]|jgi:CheY-like chemotaxis protein